MKLIDFFDYQPAKHNYKIDGELLSMSTIIKKKKIFTLSTSHLSRELNSLQLYSEKLTSSLDLILLTEPSINSINEVNLSKYIIEYEESCKYAMENSVEIVHLVSNKRWFSLFEKIIKNYNIKVYIVNKDYEYLSESIEELNTLVINNYILPSELYEYSNEIYNNVLIDLTDIKESNKSNKSYSLDIDHILNQCDEFDECYILINDNTRFFDFNSDRIFVLNEEDFYHSNYKYTYVYLYHNEPYSIEILSKSLAYAANSKVIYSNYNYAINNILPSIILSFDSNKEIIRKLDDNIAFDILNENRNTVMYNYTIVNVLNDIFINLKNESLVNPLQLMNTDETFQQHLYYKDNDTSEYICKFSDRLHNLEQTLLFPIIFLGYDSVYYKESYVESGKNSIKIIPHFERKNKKIKDKSLSVIVPIHNNGTYLKYKCFLSMLNLSIFDELEIIFIDDGSNDKNTLRIVNELLFYYPDIEYKRFDTGSGSASRPRNVGMKMANCDLITFLDPDNESIEDGFSHLLKEMLNDDTLDLIVGNIIREDNFKRNEINYYKKLYKVTQSDLIEDTRQALIKSKLTVQSIQAFIVKKSILIDNYLTMVEGAAGQDTLFYQQLFLLCSKVRILEHNIHSYYAYVEGSVTNTVNSKFFEKFFKVEKERVKFLESQDLMEYYMDIKFNSYFKNWYMYKYSLIDDYEEKKIAKNILRNILSLYSAYIKHMDTDLMECLDGDY